MNQQMSIENQFISTQADQLNEEIVLGTIQNAQEVVGNTDHCFLANWI